MITKERIQKLCEVHHTNLNALQNILGYNVIGRLKNYLSGNQKTLKLDDVLILAEYFGVSVDYLVGRTDELDSNYKLKVKELLESSYEKYLYSKISQDSKLNIQLLRSKPVAMWPYNLIEAAEIPMPVPASESMKANLEEVVDKKLSKREAICVRLYFEQYMTLNEVAEKFDVTTERIRQILSKACRKLKHPSLYKYIQYGLDYDEKLEEDFQRQMKDVFKKRIEGGMIRDLGFSVRTYNCLIRSGIETVNQLLEMDVDELISIRNLGKRSLDEILHKFPQIAKVEAAYEV